MHANRSIIHAFIAVFTVSTASAQDEPATPGFDRPGLLFATDTVPAGRFVLEQGLADVAHDETGDVDVTSVTLGTLLRYGFARDWEFQAGLAPLARLEVDAPGNDFSETGQTDLRLGVKHRLGGDFGEALGGADVAFLGGVTLPTGDDAFSADDEVVDLGLTANWALDRPGTSIGALAQVTTGGGSDDLLLAGAYSAPLSGSAGYYLEAGLTLGDSDGTVLGGGLAWTPWRDTQLDVYGLAGVSGDAPDLQAGLGFSWFFR